MLKPIVISIKDLEKVDPTKDCFIVKGVLPAGNCYELVNYLTKFSDGNEENKRFKGENWHYFVRSHGNYFDSFLFNDLYQLGNADLTRAYETLFQLYNSLGEKTELNSFSDEIRISDFHTDYRIINPLVFYYFSEKSRFGFHKHDVRNQKFQLLMNLTQPGLDYLCGETWVYTGSGLPDSPGAIDQCVVFGDEFEIGDVFSFPYHLWHKVEIPRKGRSHINARVSLLMPIGCRNSQEYRNEVL